MIVVRDSINVPFEVEIHEGGEPLDISASTTEDIILEKPNSKEKVTIAGAYVNTGTDGRLLGRSATNNLDEVGTWRVYAHVVTGSYDIYTPPSTFQVVDRKID